MVRRTARAGRRLLVAAGTICALILTTMLGLSPAAQAAAQSPCDVFASGGTPCVAAYSMVRAMYASYDGSLYQIERASDDTTLNIGLLSTGGYVDAAAQVGFCAGTTCTVTEIYDQSAQHNNLPVSIGGYWPGPGTNGADVPADAMALPVSVDGHAAYGLKVNPGVGYRTDAATGVATGSQPEGIYEVTSGTISNGGCCFDFGSGETSNTDTGAAHMNAIYWGTSCWFGGCTGHGPWVEADLENGLYSSATGPNASSNTGVQDQFVSAWEKNDGTSNFTLKYGNADSGGLTTTYSGALPSGYSPMHAEASILLGVGGDNSNGGAGAFFEGAMTSGYPSDATENAVQANITNVGYTASATPFVPGARISIQATTACCTGDYLQHDASDTKVVIAPVTSSSTAQNKADSTWIVTSGLANPLCISLESANESGQYLRHSGFELWLEPNDSTYQFAEDATFCPTPGNSGTGYSLQSINYPDHFIRHFDWTAYVASNGGSHTWDSTTSWHDDTSWLAASPWS
ncbi:MAG TPA: alpha-L-arabinofuranosidase B [Actinospica sp.]|jgi:hypothetical protein|nr:alpha-L-arabinofuranosidase B [Actinospica sp.]